MPFRDYIPVGDIMDLKIPSISPEDTAYNAASIMAQLGVGSLIVTRGKTVCGIISGRDLLERASIGKTDLKTLFVKDLMSLNVAAVSPKDPVWNAGRMIRDLGYNMLPVVENEELVGVISRGDVSGALGSLGYFLKAEDVMSNEYVCVGSESSVLDGIKKMEENSSKYVLVMDGQFLAGILTEKDVVKKIITSHADPKTAKIADVMSPNVTVIDRETTLTEASRLLKNRGISQLPVLSGGRVAGIISRKHILGALESLDLEYNALSSIANLAMQSSSVSVSQMLDQKVSIRVPSVEYVPIQSIPSLMGSRSALAAGIYLEIMGELSGSAMLIFPEDVAYALSDMLLSKEKGSTREIDEMAGSALKEMCNVMVGSYLKVLAENLHLSVNYSVPYFAFDMVGSVIDHALLLHSKRADDALVSRTSCRVSSMELEGLFLFLFTPESIKTIEQKLKISGYA